MKRLIVTLLLELLVALLAAWAAHAIFPEHLVADVLFGVGLLLILLLFHQHLAIHELAGRSERLRGVLDSLRAEDGFSELLLIHSPRPLNLAGHDHIRVPPDSVRTFWKDCVSRANQSWKAVSYVHGTDTWFMAWANWAVAIQTERLVSQCRIERLFIFDSHDERTKFENPMQEQCRAGVDVRWLMKAETDVLPQRDTWLGRIGSLDYALIDGVWVYVTHLDAERRIAGATATRTATACEAARELFGELWQLAGTRGQVVKVAP